VWNLLFEAQVMCEHYLLYPNPWPKKKHLKRRWYAHPIFPRLLATSKSITMRTNWRIYALEFSIALSLYGVAHSMRRFEVSGDCLTLFELKYSESGHELYEITTNG
jgi:tRNA G46 methylase TrmB